MSTKTKRNSKVTYWRNMIGYSWWVLDSNNKTPTKVGAFNCLEVSYNYDCPDNTFLSDRPVRVAKKAFEAKMEELQTKYGVKFSIKTEWGTNADT
jgi:hypothetical protein